MMSRSAFEQWTRDGEGRPLLAEYYQQADEATLLQVVSEPRKLRETIAGTIAAASGKQ
jgi:hypothetical protein